MKKYRITLTENQIRVRLGISRWDKALHLSDEPLPEIEEVE